MPKGNRTEERIRQATRGRPFTVVEVGHGGRLRTWTGDARDWRDAQRRALEALDTEDAPSVFRLARGCDVCGEVDATEDAEGLARCGPCAARRAAYLGSIKSKEG